MFGGGGCKGQDIQPATHRPSIVVKISQAWHGRIDISHICFFRFILQTGKSPRYYPAEDIKPTKAVHKVKQNVSPSRNIQSLASGESSR